MYNDEAYSKKNLTWHVEDSPWKARQILRMLELHQIRPKTICEVGCGAGEILNQLHMHLDDECHLVGYDVSPYAIKLCKERQKERLSFHQKDFTKEEDASFDVVLCIDVIEHIEDYFSFLRELKSKGKYKIFHFPLDLSVQAVLRRKPILEARVNVGHIHYFTKEISLQVLRDTGYEIIDYSYTAGSVDLPAQSTISSVARLLRKLVFSLNRDMCVRILGGFSLLVLTT